jgi:hypothetical protein
MGYLRQTNTNAVRMCHMSLYNGAFRFLYTVMWRICVGRSPRQCYTEPETSEQRQTHSLKTGQVIIRLPKVLWQ